MRNYIASARMEQHFRPTMTDPGYDVVTENRYYVAADGIEWEELSFSVNGSKWGADRPPFPLLQPEKVLSLPLQLRFGNDYRYRLEGTERVGEYDCYVVRFDPGRETRSRCTGARSGSSAGRSPGSRFSRADRPLGAGRLERGDPELRAGRSGWQPPVFLFGGLTRGRSSSSRGATFSSRRGSCSATFASTMPAFEEARAEARRSDRIMYRETDKGCATSSRKGTNASSASGRRDRQGHGDGRDARPVVRLPAADPRHQLSRLRVSRAPGYAARDAVRRRARRGQHPATQSSAGAARRQRRLLRDCGAVDRQALRGRASGRRSGC